MEAAAKRLGTMLGWRVGPDLDQEVFKADEYRKHAKLGDYTRSMIVASRPSGGFIETKTETAPSRTKP